MTKPTVRSVGVHEAKTHLSELLRAVAVGEVVEITRNGVALARIVPVPNEAPRTFGIDQGAFIVPDDFDAPLPVDVLAEFEA